MAMASMATESYSEEMEGVLAAELVVAVLEEIDEDGEVLVYGKSPERVPVSPEQAVQKSVNVEAQLSPVSPVMTRRDFGNISPISDLSEDDDIEVVSPKQEEDEDSESAESTEGKVTPEPGHGSNRTSFPRISDGRASPILAYSPSLLKSPSTSLSNGKSRIQTSPSTSGSGGGVGKRPRNIARILDNISDHSSGEEDVNTVGVMMARFTV